MDTAETCPSFAYAAHNPACFFGSHKQGHNLLLLLMMMMFPLALGRAAWWIPNPGRAAPNHTTQHPNHLPGTSAEDTRKLSFAAALKDLLQNLSFHCYSKLVEPGRRIKER